MRVGFASYRVRSRPLRRSSSGEACHGEIETSPEKMYRTDLANKSGAEFLEYLIDPHQDTPELMHGFRIVRRMCAILLKRNRIGNLAGHCPYLHRHTEFGKSIHEFLIELRNALRLERDRGNTALAGFEPELVVDEVKSCFDCSTRIGHHRSRHSSCAHVEGYVPPMIHQRTQFEAHFSDSLRPHVHRG